MSLLKSSARSKYASRLHTMIDFGTTKTTCVMVEIIDGDARANELQHRDGMGAAPAPYNICILGAAHRRSMGIKAGVVADLNGVETSLKSLVGQVERQSGIEVKDLIFGVSCGRLKSNNFRASTPLEGKTVSLRDIERLSEAGRNYCERSGRVLIHSNLVGFRLDEEAGIVDPVGLAGDKLSQEIHMVSADAAPLKNLLMSAERCYYNVEGLIPSAHASAEAVLTSEEKKLGVIAIDLGGGTSSFAVYADGHFIHIDSITLGGDHITYDIARALSTPLHEAERIKTLYGAVINASSDEFETVTYQRLCGDGRGVQNISKAALGRIIRPRVEEILSLVRGRISACGIAGYAGDRVVLTGGAGQLQGIGEFAAHFLGRSVRLGSPANLVEMPFGMDGPAFSNVIGQILLTARGAHQLSFGTMAGKSPSQRQGYLGEVGHWLRESF